MADEVSADSKEHLISLLNAARAALLYGFFIETLAHKLTNVTVAAAAGKAFRFEFGDASVNLDLGILAGQLTEFEREIRGNYYLQLEHQAIRTFYELVYTYCKRSNQTSAYASEPFMQFARVWRNVVSHGDGAVLREWPGSLKKKGVTTVRWRNRVLMESQVGSQVSLNIVDIINLQEDVYAFCQEKLQ